MHIVAGFFLVANAGTYHQALAYQKFYLVLPIYIIALFSLAYGFLRKRVDPAARYNHWVRLLQCLVFAVLVIFMINLGETVKAIGLFLWVIITGLLVFTERRVFQQPALQLQDNGILVPGYFKDHLLPWPVLEDLVLRPDYITLFRRDKKFVQLELRQPLPPAEINTINTYSKQQIAQFSQAVLDS